MQFKDCLFGGPLTLTLDIAFFVLGKELLVIARLQQPDQVGFLEAVCVALCGVLGRTAGETLSIAT